MAVFALRQLDDLGTSLHTRWLLRRDPALYFQRQALAARYGLWLGDKRVKPWRTWGIAALLVLVYLAQSFSGLDASVARAALVKPLVLQGQWWRLLTGPMMHGNAIHIFFNLGAWVALGPTVERTAGRRVLAPVFLLAALAGSLFSLFLLPGVPSVGASGGIMGLVGFLVVVGLRRRHILPPSFAASMVRTVALVAAMGILTWAFIDNAGHLGGLLGGMALGLVLVPAGEERLPLEETPASAVADALALLGVAAACGWSVWKLVG